MPPATSKKRPVATADSASPTSKQAKQNDKKSSVSAPQPKPAKKRKSARESNEENAIPDDSGPPRESFPIKGFALSEQTARKLSAWRFQPPPSISTIVEATANSDPHTDHQSDSPSSMTSSTVAPAQQALRVSSNTVSESITSPSTNPRSSFTSSTVTPATSSSLLRDPTAESHPLLSPVTSLDASKHSQGSGHSVYGSATHSPSSNRLTMLKPPPLSQAALISPCPPPISGHHVLETIFEESPPSSIERARGLPGSISEPSIVPIYDSTEPSSTDAVDLDDPYEDDVFDDLEGVDLLDLGLSFEVPRAAQPASSVNRCNIDQDIIDLVSDDEWNILEEEEIAFLDLTDDAAHTMTPASTVKIRDRGK